MRIAKNAAEAFQDLFCYGSSIQFIPCVTNGPDKPQHIFAGRNDMETTMTKPVFDAYTPLPGSENAPVITAEQMSNFLYNHIGSLAAKKIAEAINSCRTPDLVGALQTTYVAPAPKFLPIDRPVRIEDVEPGDVLRFCGAASIGPCHSLTQGQEVTVSYANKLVFRVTEDTHKGDWRGTGFSFVRRPFKVGEVVTGPQYGEGSRWHGNMLVKCTPKYAGDCYLCVTAQGVERGFFPSQLKRAL